MVKKQNNMDNLETKIMDTIPLEQDFQDFYNQSYNYDQSKYTSGEKPTSDLGRKVERFTDELEDAKWDEEERLHKISDRRNYVRLSKMEPASMSWDDLELWNSLKTEYPNMSLKKMNKSNDESMTSDSLPKQMEHVLGDIDDLSRMCSEQNRDNVVAKLGEIKKLCIELFRRLETMTDNAPDGHLPDDIEAVIKKTLKKYDSSKVKKLCKCSGDKCEIQIADKLDNINVPQGSIIDIHKNGTWNVRS